MVSLHGLLLCSGNATRFAQSVEAESPYPKHLEKIGDKTILELSIEGLISNLEVQAVTVTLNPILKDTYISHLIDIQHKHPEVSLNYILTLPNEYPDSHRIDGICDGLRRDINRGIYALDGSLISFQNPVYVFAHGDALIEITDKEELKRDINGLTSQLEEGRDVMITTGGPWSGTLYYLGKINSLSDYYEHKNGISAGLYGFRVWNINRIEDLIMAKRDFGYGITENELDRITLVRPRRKESE